MSVVTRFHCTDSLACLVMITMNLYIWLTYLQDEKLCRLIATLPVTGCVQPTLSVSSEYDNLVNGQTFCILKILVDQNFMLYCVPCANRIGNAVAACAFTISFPSSPVCWPHAVAVLVGFLGLRLCSGLHYLYWRLSHSHHVLQTAACDLAWVWNRQQSQEIMSEWLMYPVHRSLLMLQSELCARPPSSFANNVDKGYITNATQYFLHKHCCIQFP